MESELLLNKEKLPEHIAFIVDGNRRWAEKKKLPLDEGHRKGSEVALRVIEDCLKLNIGVLTFYLFSTENWKRKESEITFLMQLGIDLLKTRTGYIHSKGIRIRGVGRIDELQENLRDLIHYAERLTKENRKMVVNLAINYGARREIIDAVNKILAEGSLKKVDERIFSRYLYTAGLPDPDLLIRTSGEYRLSNFLLWQIAYTEIVILPELWPELSREKLYEAIREFQRRQRRWGK